MAFPLGGVEGREGKGEALRLLAGELCTDQGRPASGKGKSSSGICSNEDGLVEDLDATDRDTDT